MSTNISSMPNSLQQVNRDVHLLCPQFNNKVQLAIAKCKSLGYEVEIFEAWRSPQRQEFLYAQGRFGDTRKIVTKARGWESWHQYGLAIDIAFKIKGKWTWDGPFDKLAPIFKGSGLEWLGPNDPGHYQLTRGLNIDIAKGYVQSVGIQRVWLEVTA